MSLKTELSRIASDIEIVLDEMIPQTPLENSPENVSRYAIMDAGKRLRSFLTVASANLFGDHYNCALRAGACLEMIHNFSLIHDDLPCIDNDDLRRGKPSVWAKYGERNAVLAGDFLLNHAFVTLSRDEKISSDPAVRIELIKILSQMTGGMIIGEWLDCEAETKPNQNESEITQIQNLKTGCLFNAATSMGAILGGATAEQRNALKTFTDAFGLCFQITDDVLDVTGDQELVGKTLNKDTAAGKATFVSIMGVDGARAKVLELGRVAKDALSIFDERADVLRELMDYVVDRRS